MSPTIETPGSALYDGSPWDATYHYLVLRWQHLTGRERTSLEMEGQPWDTGLSYHSIT
jgi:hypothetical protein